MWNRIQLVSISSQSILASGLPSSPFKHRKLDLCLVLSVTLDFIRDETHLFRDFDHRLGSLSDGNLDIAASHPIPPRSAPSRWTPVWWHVEGRIDPHLGTLSSKFNFKGLTFRCLPSSHCRFAASNVLFMSMATVMGPTPPGTGVM